jgi:dTDP-4-dehydrorhamnose reductase
MKFLIIGASGLVGNALLQEGKKLNHEVLGTYLKNKREGLTYLDYGNKKEVKTLIDNFSPDVILCPAANPNVDWNEENPKEGWNNNVQSLNNLLEIVSDKNIDFAFYSTDYLFDGKDGPYSEDVTPNPINVYGKQKLAAETLVKSYLPGKNYIFRTTLVFGYEFQGKNYAYSVVKNLSSNKEIKAANDLCATPTYVKDIARFTYETIKRKTYGTYNLASNDFISRFDFANKVAEAFNLNKSLILPTTYKEMNVKTQRPLKGGLTNKRITELTGLQFTSLEDALKDMKNDVGASRRGLQTSPDLPRQVSTSKICIFIPCYNATITLPKVFERIPKEVKEKVEEVFVIDNDSSDSTYLMAIGYREKKSDIKNLKIFKNEKNFGYGGSQKVAYAHAIKSGYDMVVMLHGDAQYAPEKLPIMIQKMEEDPSIDLLFGSRMNGDPLKGGMPFHRFLGNKALTFMQNFLLRTNISEFHSGYRIFRTSALKKVPFHLCSSDYHFDTEVIILFIKNKLNIAEVPIDTHYGDEKNYVKIWQYGLNVLIATLAFFLYQKGIRKLFNFNLEKYEMYKENVEADVEKITKDFKSEQY